MFVPVDPLAVVEHELEATFSVLGDVQAVADGLDEVAVRNVDQRLDNVISNHLHKV